MFAASMRIELLPDAGQQLVRASSRPRQDLVLGYWREVLDRPAGELADMVEATLAAVRAAGVPHLVVAGDDLPADYRGWLTEMLPQATVTVWPGSGHFPHIAHPGRFAACLGGGGGADQQYDRRDPGSDLDGELAPASDDPSGIGLVQLQLVGSRFGRDRALSG